MNTNNGRFDNTVFWTVRDGFIHIRGASLFEASGGILHNGQDSVRVFYKAGLCTLLGLELGINKIIKQLKSGWGATRDFSP